jgi:hypothetical protein
LVENFMSKPERTKAEKRKKGKEKKERIGL